MINLLDNAHKHTGNDKQVVLRAYPSNGAVSIEVRTTASGFPAAASRV
jgi:K+-sensing histidine kinase KdpD